jgi:hypothetical protein
LTAFARRLNRPNRLEPEEFRHREVDLDLVELAFQALLVIQHPVQAVIGTRGVHREQEKAFPINSAAMLPEAQMRRQRLGTAPFETLQKNISYALHLGPRKGTSRVVGQGKE